MAVVHIGGPSNGSQEFTSNKRLLSAAVDRSWDRRSSLRPWRAMSSFSMARRSQPALLPIRSTQNGASNALATTRVLTEVAEKLSAIRGRRKTILFISEGLDYDITDVMNNRAASSILDGIRGAIAAATRSNASIYSVDPRGLTSNSRRGHRGQYFRRSAALHGSGRSERHAGGSGTARYRHALAAHGAAAVAGQPQNPCGGDQRVCFCELQ